MPDTVQDNITYMYTLTVDGKEYTSSVVHVNIPDSGDDRWSWEWDYKALAEDGYCFVPDYGYDDVEDKHYIIVYRENAESGESYNADISLSLWR